MTFNKEKMEWEAWEAKKLRTCQRMVYTPCQFPRCTHIPRECQKTTILRGSAIDRVISLPPCTKDFLMSSAGLWAACSQKLSRGCTRDPGYLSFEYPLSFQWGSVCILLSSLRRFCLSETNFADLQFHPTPKLSILTERWPVPTNWSHMGIFGTTCFHKASHVV